MQSNTLYTIPHRIAGFLPMLFIVPNSRRPLDEIFLTAAKHMLHRSVTAPLAIG
jgi:hypothetical protein